MPMRRRRVPPGRVSIIGQVLSWKPWPLRWNGLAQSFLVCGTSRVIREISIIPGAHLLHKCNPGIRSPCSHPRHPEGAVTPLKSGIGKCQLIGEIPGQGHHAHPAGKIPCPETPFYWQVPPSPL